MQRFYSYNLFQTFINQLNYRYLLRPLTAISFRHEKLFINLYSSNVSIRSKAKAVTYGIKVEIFAVIMGLMLAGDVHIHAQDQQVNALVLLLRILLIVFDKKGPHSFKHA